MEKNILIILCLFLLSEIVVAKSYKKDFTTGDLIELDKEFKSERNIITKIEKLSDNKVYVECSSLVLPAAGDSVVGAHTVVVGYYFTVGQKYKQGRLLSIDENSLSFEYDAEYSNPIYLYSNPEDKQISFHFYDLESFDWDKLIVTNGKTTKEIKREPKYKFFYSFVYDGLENGEEYYFKYYVVDIAGEKSEVKTTLEAPNGKKVVVQTGFYCDISKIRCLERNRTLVFSWENSKDTVLPKMNLDYFAKANKVVHACQDFQ